MTVATSAITLSAEMMRLLNTLGLPDGGRRGGDCAAPAVMKQQGVGYPQLRYAADASLVNGFRDGLVDLRAITQAGGDVEGIDLRLAPAGRRHVDRPANKVLVTLSNYRGRFALDALQELCGVSEPAVYAGMLLASLVGLKARHPVLDREGVPVILPGDLIGPTTFEMMAWHAPMWAQLRRKCQLELSGAGRRYLPVV